jgi:hypothetical protein
MRVTISLSRQQEELLLALLAKRSHPPTLEQLIARAFDEYCQNHPEECGDRPGAG